MIVSNIVTIAKKELHSYFSSPLAYIIATFFWLVSGFFFVEILLGQQGIIQQIAYREQTGLAVGSVDVASELMTSYLAILGTLTLLIIPILSMGLYAEEKRQGTLELLITSPISNWAISLGKLLAVTLLFLFLSIPSILYEAIALGAAEPSYPVVLILLAHLGLLLMAISLLAIGMFISSLTVSNILSAILTFSVILFFWLIDLIASNFTGWLANGLKYISLLEAYNNLVLGIVNTSDLLLFFSCIFIGVFLTSQSIKLFCLNRP